MERRFLVGWGHILVAIYREKEKEKGKGKEREREKRERETRESQVRTTDAGPSKTSYLR